MNQKLLFLPLLLMLSLCSCTDATKGTVEEIDKLNATARIANEFQREHKIESRPYYRSVEGVAQIELNVSDPEPDHRSLAAEIPGRKTHGPYPKDTRFVHCSRCPDSGHPPGSESAELFTSIWKQFEAHEREISALAIQDHYFGVSFPTEKADVTDYLTGMMVSDDSCVPAELVKRNVLGGGFAVFESPVDAIGPSYRYIFTEWLPRASVQFAPTVPVFEEYAGRASSGPVLIHIPVTRESTE